MDISELNRIRGIQNMRPPLVSYIVPCYNKENYIAECIQSILNQTYRNIEIVLVDDGSTDKSALIARNVIGEYPRAKIISYEKNRGLGFALFTGYRAATGDYLCFLSADDYLTDLMKTHTQVMAMECRPDIDVTFFDGFRVGKCIEESRQITNPQIYRYLLRSRLLLFLFILNGVNFIGSLSLMHRKESYFRLGEWESDLRNCNDHDLILGQILSGAKIRMLNGTAVFYRDSLSQLSKDPGFWEIAEKVRRNWIDRVKTQQGNLLLKLVVRLL